MINQNFYCVFGGAPIESRDGESSEGAGETRLTTGTMNTDQLFTGQREMAGLGIYHYGARFYSPKLGRFLSADTIVPNPSNPQDFNRYSYVRNNPIRYVDPTGHVCSDPDDPTPSCESGRSYPNNAWSATRTNPPQLPLPCTRNCGDPDPRDDDDDVNPGGSQPLASPDPAMTSESNPSCGDNYFAYEDCYLFTWNASESDLRALGNGLAFLQIVEGIGFGVAAYYLAPAVLPSLLIIGLGVWELSDLNDARDYINDAQTYASLQPDNSVNISIVRTDEMGPFGTGIQYGNNDANVITAPIAQLEFQLIGAFSQLFDN